MARKLQRPLCSFSACLPSHVFCGVAFRPAGWQPSLHCSLRSSWEEGRGEVNRCLTVAWERWGSGASKSSRPSSARPATGMGNNSFQREAPHDRPATQVDLLSTVASPLRSQNRCGGCARGGLVEPPGACCRSRCFTFCSRDRCTCFVRDREKKSYRSNKYAEYMAKFLDLRLQVRVHILPEGRTWEL